MDCNLELVIFTSMKNSCAHDLVMISCVSFFFLISGKMSFHFFIVTVHSINIESFLISFFYLFVMQIPHTFCIFV